MFDFEKLEVYKRAKTFHVFTAGWIEKQESLHKSTRDQLFRASLSIAINIAEGGGRFSKADRRNFYVIARGSVYECFAILDIITEMGLGESQEIREMKSTCEELSKMLFAMIRNLQT